MQKLGSPDPLLEIPAAFVRSVQTSLAPPRTGARVLPDADHLIQRPRVAKTGWPGNRRMGVSQSDAGCVPWMNSFVTLTPLPARAI